MADDDVQPVPDAGVELAPRIRVPASAVRFRFVRARGPGGQNVNKVSTACELRVDFDAVAAGLTPGAIERLKTVLGSRLTAGGEIQIVSDEFRSQEQNREAVLARLREMLVRAGVEPKRRRKTMPSRAAKQRRMDAKRRRSEIKGGRRTRFEE